MFTLYGVLSQRLENYEPRRLSPRTSAQAPRLTLEALGSCLPQGKEDVTHDGGTAHSGLRDDGEDAIHVLPQALLQELGS